jgi:hypothetical protein
MGFLCGGRNGAGQRERMSAFAAIETLSRAPLEGSPAFVGTIMHFPRRDS